MRTRALRFSYISLGLAALAVTGNASAATLYTSSSHTTAVAVGTTATATNTVPTVLTSATSALNTCTTGTVNFSIAQNSGGTVRGTVTSGASSGCSPLIVHTIFFTAWVIVISGSPTISGGITIWAAVINGVAFTLTGAGNYSGNLSTGVTAREPSAGGGGSPICVNLADSGTLSGPLTTNGRIDGNFCLTGSAAAYSLG